MLARASDARAFCYTFSMITKIQYILIYLSSLIPAFLLDMVWLGFISPDLYQSQIGHLFAENINWMVGLSFYLMFPIGLIIFVIIPALHKRSLKKALLYGALFGFFCYMTYDLTNWATLKDWPALISFIDMAWGTFLAMTVSGITYIVSSKYIVKT